MMQHASQHAPTLSLAIPAKNSFTGLSSEADEAYGSSLQPTVLNGGSDDYSGGGAGLTQHASIYPDTVPYASGSKDPQSLTNDLRRAIGRVSIDSEEESRAGQRASTEIDPDAGTTMGRSTRQFELQDGSSDQTIVEATTRPYSSAASVHGTETKKKGSRPGSSQGPDLEDESELNLKGNLEVLNRLGEGASGEVRRARYKPTGMIMATKVCLGVYNGAHSFKRVMTDNPPLFSREYDRRSTHLPIQQFTAKFYESSRSIDRAIRTTSCATTAPTLTTKTQAL